MFGEFKSNCEQRALDLDMTKVCMYIYYLQKVLIGSSGSFMGMIGGG
jgi:hypothetical protein